MNFFIFVGKDCIYEIINHLSFVDIYQFCYSCSFCKYCIEPILQIKYNDEVKDKKDKFMNSLTKFIQSQMDIPVSGSVSIKYLDIQHVPLYGTYIRNKNYRKVIEQYDYTINPILFDAPIYKINVEKKDDYWNEIIKIIENDKIYYITVLYMIGSNMEEFFDEPIINMSEPNYKLYFLNINKLKCIYLNDRF